MIRFQGVPDTHLAVVRCSATTGSVWAWSGRVQEVRDSTTAIAYYSGTLLRPQRF